jgi:hypothetical protein
MWPAVSFLVQKLLKSNKGKTKNAVLGFYITKIFAITLHPITEFNIAFFKDSFI